MKITQRNLLQLLAMTVMMSFGGQLMAQESPTEKKKVVIVEKTIDEDGVEVVKEKVLEGDEAEAYLKEQELEEILEREIDIEEIIDRAEDEELRIIEIEKRFIEDFEDSFNVEVEEENGQYNIRITRDGEEMEWEGVGELPEDVLKELEDLDIVMPDMSELEHEMIMIHEEQEDRAVLGVLIENVGGNGAMITEVFEDSGADDAGLREGDIIYKVDGEQVTDVEDLVDALRGKSVGDKVKVKYLREGKKKSDRVVMGQMKHKAFAPSCKVEKVMKCHPGDVAFKGHNKTKNVKKIVVVKDGVKEVDVIVDDVNPVAPTEIELYELNVYPNPGEGEVNLEFKAAAVPTVIRVLSVDGREIYREELNDFNGSYNQRIDIDREEGGVILQIQQNGKVFTETIMK